MTTLPNSYAVVMKSGNLNFLELSGPLQACNGTALPLPYEEYILTDTDHARFEFGKSKFEIKFVIFVLQILFNAKGVTSAPVTVTNIACLSKIFRECRLQIRS